MVTRLFLTIMSAKSKKKPNTYHSLNSLLYECVSERENECVYSLRSGREYHKPLYQPEEKKVKLYGNNMNLFIWPVLYLAQKAEQQTSIKNHGGLVNA